MRAIENAVYTVIAWLPVLAILAIVGAIIMSLSPYLTHGIAAASMGSGHAGANPAGAAPPGSITREQAEEAAGFECENPPAYVAAEMDALCSYAR